MKRAGAEPSILAWPNNSSERTAHSARFWVVRGFFPCGPPLKLGVRRRSIDFWGGRCPSLAGEGGDRSEVKIRVVFELSTPTEEGGIVNASPWEPCRDHWGQHCRVCNRNRTGTTRV
jgi:hypothetical protein